jgi:hypothetical protein
MRHGRPRACPGDQRGHPRLSKPHPNKDVGGRPSPAMTRMSQAQRWLVLVSFWEVPDRLLRNDNRKYLHRFPGPAGRDAPLQGICTLVLYIKKKSMERQR